MRQEDITDADRMEFLERVLVLRREEAGPAAANGFVVAIPFLPGEDWRTLIDRDLVRGVEIGERRPA